MRVRKYRTVHIWKVLNSLAHMADLYGRPNNGDMGALTTGAFNTLHAQLLILYFSHTRSRAFDWRSNNTPLTILSPPHYHTLDTNSILRETRDMVVNTVL